MACWRRARSWSMGRVPTMRSRGWPSLKITKVGMLRTSYCSESGVKSSTFSLAKPIFPLNSAARVSVMGASSRHGAHQGAQKSTTVVPWATASAKVWSVRCWMRSDIRRLLRKPSRLTDLEGFAVMTFSWGSGALGPAGGGGGDALAQELCALAIGQIGLNVRGHLTGLGHEAREATQTVDALLVAGHLGIANPNHAVLHGEDHQRLEGVQLVAAGAAADGEAGGQLVLPLPLEPGLRAGVHEGLEGAADVAHVGGAAKDDGIRGFEVRPVGVDLLDWNEQNLGAGDGFGAGLHAFRHHLGMAIAAVEHDGNLGHPCLLFGRLHSFGPWSKL